MQSDREVWVHIGLPKCGSTSIQRHFASHHDGYLRRGLCYPERHRSAVGYRSHRPLSLVGPEDMDRAVAEIAAEAGGSARILISHEGFSSALPGGAAGALVAALNRAFSARQVRVVAYFRNVYDFVESAYAQFLWGGLFGIDKRSFFQGAPAGISKFLDAFEAQKGFPLYSPLGYARLIRATFPDNAVLLRSLEEGDLGGVDLVEDLCRMIGIAPLRQAKARNRRASGRAIAAAQFAQGIMDQESFARIRQQLRQLEFGAAVAEETSPFRNTDICISADQHDRIRQRLQAESGALSDLFATGIEALCRDGWSPPVSGLELSEGEKGGIARLAEGGGS